VAAFSYPLAFMPPEPGHERLATVGEREQPRYRAIGAGNTISLCDDEVVRRGERAAFAQLPQQHARPIFDLVEPRKCLARHGRPYKWEF
jgi:hypothetical protein